MGAGVAADEFEDWVCDGFQQRDGEAGRERNSQAIAVAGGVLSGDEAAFASHADLEEAAGADEPV